MKCETCKNEATISCSWGLFEPGAKIKEKYRKKLKNKDEFYYDYIGCYNLNEIYEENWKTREEPMNKAKLCNDCADNLWKSVKGAVNAGLMYWLNKNEN